NYVKKFSDKFKEQDVPPPVPVSEPPADLLTQSRIKRGKKLYNKYGCRSCHGKNGKGNGPTADQQTDHWGEPVPPRDLTRGNFKGGEEPKDIYRRIVTGITGTGMPPIGSALKSEQERWALVAYVKSLGQDSQSPTEPQPGDEALFVKRVQQSKKKLKEPGSPVWEQAERVRMPLYSLWLTDRTPFDSVEVRALHNGDQLAVRMSWNDPTRNMKPVDVTEYTDGGAVMFPEFSGALPFIGMGSAEMDGGMAHIWHWRASDQFAVNRGGPSRDLEDRYPGMQVNYYKQKDGWEPGQRARFENREQHTKNQPKVFQSAWAADNPISEPSVKTPVRSYRAKGFGTLTALEYDKMRTDGSGTYEDNRWAIVMTRPMQTETDVVQFKPGERTTAAFAVWDGAQQDRNGQKDITSWITLRLEQLDKKDSSK
ncbi:MAG: ethylbenzene dehydrogenase-related protein, partial [bacterium]